MSTGAIRAGAAFVELFCDDSKLMRSLGATSRKLKSWGREVSSIGSSLMTAGIAASSGFVASAAIFAKTGDSLSHMSERTGISVESLSELGFVAKRTGIESEDLETAIKRMSKVLKGADSDSSAARNKLEQLGLSMQDLKGLGPEKQFEALAKRISEIKDPTTKMAVAMEIFGKSGSMLIPMMNDMDSLRAEAKRLGITISTETAEAGHQLSNSFENLWAVIQRGAVTIGSELEPLLTRNIASITSLIVKSSEWISKNAELATNIFQVVVAITALGASLYAFGKVTALIGGIVAALNPLNVLLLLVAASVGMLITKWLTGKSIGDMVLEWTNRITGLKNALSDLNEDQKKEKAKQTRDSAFEDALKSGDKGAASGILASAKADAAVAKAKYAAAIDIRENSVGSLQIPTADRKVQDAKLEMGRAEAQVKMYEELQQKSDQLHAVEAKMTGVINDVAGAFGSWADPLVESLDYIEQNKDALQELNRIRAEGLTDAMQREIALKNLEYDKKKLAAIDKGQDPTLIEKARQGDIANIRAEYAAKAQEKQKQEAEKTLTELQRQMQETEQAEEQFGQERIAAEDDVYKKMAEAEIEASDKTQKEKEKALFDLKQKNEKKDLLEKGIDPALIDELQKTEAAAFKKKSFGGRQTSSMGIWGGINARGMGYGTGSNYAEETAKNTKEVKFELNRIRQEGITIKAN